jgi:hypothetical protein
MEFEDMKKVWDAQKLEHVFQIDQAALHQRVARKMAKGLYIANVSEWLLIVTNVLAGCTILFMYLPKETLNISMIIMSCWMLVSAAYVVYARYRRTQQLNQFGRTLKDELGGALDVARYQVKLSSLGRWNALPIAVLSVTGLLEADKAFWITIVVILFFIVLNYAAGWEVNVYKRRLAELEALKQKLEGE